MAANNKCSDCGLDREPKYKNDSCCKNCRSERNKAKRVKRMLDLGKQPYGSGRNRLCSSCKNPKEPGRENESRCISCKSEAYKANRLKKRLEAGLRPLGSGRDPLCYECKGPKEDPNAGYCSKCKSEKERLRYLRNREDEGFVRQERQKYSERFKNDSIFRHKVEMRRIANICIKQGVLIRQPCEVCGELKVDAHHDDYMKPLDVRWLCRKHHNEHHRNEFNKLKET
jgi:hypothetical protein